MYITFDEIMDYKRQINKLKADNKRLNDKDVLYDEVKELQVEIKELEADNVRLVEQVSSNSSNSSSTHTHTKEDEMDAVDYNETCVTCGKHWH